MPFYEYECQSCKYYTEVMQKISDPPLTKCPSCGKKALKKLVSAPVFRLKGGGWYETDFKSDKENKRNLAGADREDSGGESKSDDAKAEPAKVAEAKPATEAKSSGGESAVKPSGGGKSSGSSKRVVTVPAKPAKVARPAAKAASRKPAKAAKPPARKARR
jgi:putative FmdB family regulatory protein